MFDFIVNSYIVAIIVFNVGWFLFNLWMTNDTLDDRQDLQTASAILWEVVEELGDYNTTGVAMDKLNEAQDILFTY